MIFCNFLTRNMAQKNKKMQSCQAYMFGQKIDLSKQQKKSAILKLF